MNIVTQMLEERWQALDDAVATLKEIVEEGGDMNNNGRFLLVKQYGYQLLEAQRIEAVLKSLSCPKQMFNRVHRKVKP